MRTLGELKIEAARRPLETAFWHNRFPPDRRRTGFTPDRAPAGTEPPLPATTTAVLDAGTTAALDRMSRNDPAGLHALLTAGVAALLHLYTGDREPVLGSPIRRDPDRADEPLAWTLPLSFAVGPDATLESLARAAAATIAEATRHQDYPFKILTDQLGLPSDAQTNPLFDVAVALEGHHEPIPYETVPVPVTFGFARTPDGLRLTVRYESRRFEEATARRLARRLCVLLDRLAAAPGAPLGDLELRDEADDAWLASLVDPPVPFDDTVRLHELFERRAAANPDALAVVAGAERLGYGDLDRRANRLARTLRDHGAGPDVVVAVMADRSPEMLVAILAILKAGGAYLPIDTGYPPARIEYLLTDSRAGIVVGQPKYLDGLPAGVTPVDLADPASYADRDDALDAPGSASDLAYVIYTSGSTGMPKGVAVEHRSVVNRLAWMQRAYPIGPGDVILQKTPISFDVSVWELFWWMTADAAVCLLEPGAQREPAAIVAAVARAGVTVMHFVPSMLGSFLDYAAGEPDEVAALAGLRTVFASGEALSPSVVRRFHELLRPDGAGPALVNLYGPTEATVDVSHHPCDDPDPRRVPIGRPIDNIRLHVLDERLRPLPAGVPGELCIAGVGLARGYLHRPELTAERFVADPFDGEDRIYRTGDLARRLDDGAIEFLGRLDHQVKIRGFRIEPGEIEEALRAHPAVADAVVVAREAAGGQPALIGYAVAPADVTETELDGHLRGTLPDHLVPSRIVVLDAMPLTPSGKLDRRALPEPPAKASAFAGHAAPRAGTEAELAAIWRDVLGLDEVDARDNFFAVGGDSIHFVVVLGKARERGLSFTFQELFQHPTVESLAAHLDARTDDEEPEHHRSAPFSLISEDDRARLPADAEDAYPLSMLQAGLIFQSEIMRGTAHYHDIISYLIQSPFDADVFAEAVGILVRRNPILRTTYHLDGYSEYLQVVHRDVPLPLEVTDLRGMSADEQQNWYDTWLVTEKERAFDWSVPSTLIRLYVQVLGENLYRYNISLHNSTLDGWSINLVHAEVFDLYYRLRAGQGVEPGLRDNHSRNFLGLERRALASSEDKDFWAGVLADRPRTTVPASMPSGSEFSVVMSHFDIPLELSDRIVGLAERLSVPVKNVLMAAHLRVLGMVGGDPDVMTGYEHSGRPELEGADRAIGMFLNTVPFRIRLDDRTWEDLVRDVYRAEIDFLPHRRYPMARMKQDLATQEGLFETTFNFTHFYSLKELKRLPEFDLLNVQVQAETEFVLRAEFSRHFFHDNIRLSLHYYANVIGAEQADRLGGYYLRALDLMTRDPLARYGEQTLLDDAELALVVDEWPSSSEDRVYVLDAFGLPAPVGTEGEIVASRPERPGGKADPWRAGAALEPTGRRGRWTFDGVLERAADPVPDAPAPAPDAAEFAAPATPTERAIADVWARVLGIPVERISANDAFFALGGNSLAALRVVMDLRGRARLIDVMRHPRLSELAEVIDGAAAESPERAPSRLRLLTAASGTAAGTLVCFPYAAGHAVNYLPLADAVARHAPGVALHAVELPGHDPQRPGEPFQDVRTAARAIADEILATVSGPIVLWGQCGGASPTVEVGRLLEERGADLRHVFVGAKLFLRVENLHAAMELARTMTDAEIVQWLTERAGFTHADGLDPDQAGFISRLFRHDVESGHQYNLDAHGEPAPVKVRAPFTVVCAKDDVVVAEYPEKWRDWGRVAADVRLHELDHGGHYFVRTRAADVAGLVRDALTESPVRTTTEEVR
ncbi:non-ribosomal peptide synthetase [Actinomadura chibensis]|nr:non-ribosomal peptide synthetase [Actinomadura chibensis]